MVSLIEFFFYFKISFYFSSKTFFVINPSSDNFLSSLTFFNFIISRIFFFNYFSLLSSFLILLSVGCFSLIIVLLWFLFIKFTTITIIEIIIIPKNIKPKIYVMRKFKFYKVHVMFCPKHKGNLIFPCLFGHFDICNELFSFSSVSINSFSSHLLHVALRNSTFIPFISCYN